MRGTPVIVETNLENIPMIISGFTGTEDSFPDSVYKELKADQHVYRHYRSANGKQVDLYIGYYGTARGGRTGHNPNACFSGAGWEFLENKKSKLKADYLNKEVSVNYLLIKKGLIYDCILHWYQSAGTKVLDSGFKQNLQRFIGRTLYNRNDGAFVRVSVSTNKDGIENANQLVKAFAEEILNLLPSYWPVEK